jgi:aryl-alcohol dehydrogenase-like predicted oxidoreductase
MSSIEYRNLGRNGIKVSPITLGTMMFGDQTPENVAKRITDKAFAQGINFIDTANNYNGGASEEVVGRLIADRRAQWVLATKFINPNPGSDGPNNKGASRNNVIQSVDASLRRLNTDYIDLFYLHREDIDTPVEETLRALSDLIRAGKIRTYGLSNHRAWKLAEFSRTADLLGIERPSASQPLYNLANRQIESEHLPAAEDLPLLLAPTKSVVSEAKSILTDFSLRKFAISRCWIRIDSSLKNGRAREYACPHR